MTSKTANSSNAHNQQKKEFQVRIPKTANKRLTILKFNESLNVRPQRWVMETLRMEREDNRRAGVTTSGSFVQEFGEGSEYGKAAREEARLKKFGRQTRKYEHDKQPWRLTIEQNVSGDADSKQATKVRKFRSMREAGASEHADYWIFYKSGNDLEAYKVDEWYQFLPAVTYKYLDAEQAEERFKERDNVLNHFALKAQIQKQLAEQEDQLQQQQRQKIGDTLKRAGGLKIKDEASSDEDEDNDVDEEEQNGKSKNGSKKKKDGKKGKKVKNEKEEKNKTKKQRVKAADEIADYESEDGQDEGREYDYMSDSGSDSEREELNVDQKMEDDLVGVADEQGLKHDLDSEEDDDDFDDEDDDEEEEEKKDQEGGKKDGVKEQNETADSRAKAVKNVDKMMEQNTGAKIRADFDNGEESEDSDFDEDPDSARVNSVLFMQDKRKAATSSSSSQQRKRQEPGGTGETQQSSSISEQPEVKRAKITSDEPESEVITESFIRKLLEKRPHSTKQLLTKVNQRFQQQHKQDDNQTPPVKDKKIVAQLAEILKKIEPYQFRKKNEAGKDVLYFSMNRTA
uniref:Transcription initiation factor IIF subunit alpha n=1 Tax=Meloidogyne incognita TaxID=6306 RepID=A0A914MIE8_MELIC